MSKNVTYDDRDSILNYSPNWFRTGTYNATSVGQTGTLASSQLTDGVNVTFVFPSSIPFFISASMKRCCGGSYLICIDCDPNDRKFITINAVDTSDNGQNPPVVLYSQKFSTPGVHEVILMNQPDLAFGGNSQITLDRFELTVPDPAAIQSASVAPTSTSLNIASSIPSAGASLGQSSTAPSTASEYLAPILGGVLGGVATLLILVLIWLLVRRRSRRRPLYNEEQTSGGDNQQQSLWRQSTATWVTVPATVNSTTLSSNTSRREQDAGLIVSSEDTLDTLPPEYGQVFNRTARPTPTPHSESSASEPPRPVPKARR
ncbi:hypothetical protein C8R43DRAFT_961986 [Mycena crocata]|nr:hypothetical protein C8R43DRAFT_961986 [Mycena crocata]